MVINKPVIIMFRLYIINLLNYNANNYYKIFYNYKNALYYKKKKNNYWVTFYLPQTLSSVCWVIFIIYFNHVQDSCHFIIMLK